MTRQEVIEECARVLDERAQEKFGLYETLRTVNPTAAGSFNLAAREALQCAATIRALGLDQQRTQT